MGLINVVELKPEMVLAEDLKDPKGRFLLGKGSKLTSKSLRILKMWGVIEANIEGVSQKDVEADILAQLDPEFVERAEEEIGERFGHADLKHPAIRKLFRLSSLRKAKEISERVNKDTWDYRDTSREEFDTSLITEGAAKKIDPEQLIRNKINLPSLPTIYGQINETLQKPTSSANDIAKVISKDTSLSARLLRIVNSTFYGFPSKIDTLSRSVTIIGTRQLSTLALGMNIIRVFKDIPSHLIDMKSFWEHSIACGISARVIAGYNNIQNTERLFVAGLLHDIGRLILYDSIPVQSKEILLRARYTDELLYRAETETIGFDHTIIGGLLLKKWKLPISLENIVTYHHNPQDSKDLLEPAIVHVADILTNAIGMGSSGERFIPPLNPNAWECIGLSPNILTLTINQLDREIEEIIRFLF